MPKYDGFELDIQNTKVNEGEEVTPNSYIKHTDLCGPTDMCTHTCDSVPYCEY